MLIKAYKNTTETSMQCISKLSLLPIPLMAYKFLKKSEDTTHHFKSSTTPRFGITSVTTTKSSNYAILLYHTIPTI